MKSLPHHYVAVATGQASGDLLISSRKVAPFHSAAPEEFDGPGDKWSPETLLVAAVADCFILTFRAIARASHFNWIELSCEVKGTLDRVEGATQFTHFLVRPTLVLPADADAKLGHQLLEKAERGCLISNSLCATKELVPEVQRLAA